MFTAIILACTLNKTECTTFMYPDILPSKEICMQVLAGGIAQTESKGWLVSDYVCYEWPKET